MFFFFLFSKVLGLGIMVKLERGRRRTCSTALVPNNHWQSSPLGVGTATEDYVGPRLGLLFSRKKTRTGISLICRLHNAGLVPGFVFMGSEEGFDDGRRRNNGDDLGAQGLVRCRMEAGRE